VRKYGFFILALIIFISLEGCGKSFPNGTASGTKGEDINNASLMVTPDEKTISIQKIYKLKASVSLPDGYTEEISEYATWVSSNESVVTVNNQSGSKGLIRTIAPGSAIVTARFDNLTSMTRITVTQSNQEPMSGDARIVFLHTPVGNCVWAGGVPEWFVKNNAQTGKNYSITGMAFPKNPNNSLNTFPYGYWNIWVSHAGQQPYREEPTLEVLTKAYQIIILEQGSTVSSILPDTGKGSVQSPERRIENYKLQYQALKEKMRSFPGTRFIVWTGGALVPEKTTESQAKLAREFFTWVKNEWDVPGDNIYIWDFFELETDGGIFLNGAYAVGPGDSNPNNDFSKRVAPSFCKRVVDVIQGRGDTGSLMGQ
jgi:hypothetical protein